MEVVVLVIVVDVLVLVLVVVVVVNWRDPSEVGFKKLRDEKRHCPIPKGVFLEEINGTLQGGPPASYKWGYNFYK